MSKNKTKSRIKTAKGRKIGSTLWLQRQLNDPYVAKAKELGYRGRAAFKLLDIDEKFNFLKPGQIVVDLGAAPGGWCQVATQKGAHVVAIDLLDMDELPGVDFIKMDFMDDDAPEKLRKMLHKINAEIKVDLSAEALAKADLVLSDMAPNTTGHKQTDHLRIMAVVEAAYLFSTEVLKPGGAFVAKVFQGGAQNTLMAEMHRHFDKVKHFKPPASRKDSSEQYVVATGFKGNPAPYH